MLAIEGGEFKRNPWSPDTAPAIALGQNGRSDSE
jgi:hypothetical protein